MSAAVTALSVCDTMVPVPASALQEGCLARVIEHDQAPFLVAESSRAAADWQHVGMHNILEKFPASTQVDVLVSRSGVVGYYKPANVHVSMREGRIFGRSKVPGLLPEEDIELPHLQLENRFNLGQLVSFMQHRPATPDAPERVYLRLYGKLLPLLGDYLPTQIPLDPATFSRLSFYLSQAGTATNLHVDLYSGVIHQLKGRKRVILFAPEAANIIPMNPPNHVLARRARYAGRLSEEVFTTHPELTQVRGYECIIEPNQWLYIPAHWLHYVETLDKDTISLITRFTK